MSPVGPGRIAQEPTLLPLREDSAVYRNMKTTLSGTLFLGVQTYTNLASGRRKHTYFTHFCYTYGTHFQEALEEILLDASGLRSLVVKTKETRPVSPSGPEKAEEEKDEKCT